MKIRKVYQFINWRCQKLNEKLNLAMSRIFKWIEKKWNFLLFFFHFLFEKFKRAQYRFPFLLFLLFMKIISLLIVVRVQNLGLYTPTTFTDKFPFWHEDLIYLWTLDALRKKEQHYHHSKKKSLLYKGGYTFGYC